MPLKPPWVWIREDWEAKQRRFQEPAKPRSRAMKWLTWIFVSVSVIVLAPFALLLVLIALGIGQFLFLNAPVQTPMTVEVSGNTVVLERKSIHILLAEYERTILVFRDGQEVGRTTLALDSGGGGRMNVYQIDDDTLVLYDRFGAVALHLRNASLSSARALPRERVPGVFLGAFDRVPDGERKTYRFVPATERSEQPIRVQIPDREWPSRGQPGSLNTLSASLPGIFSAS